MSGDSATPWPKRGLAGAVSSAVTHAPDDADDMAILSVGYTAWDEERDVQDVWQEVLDDE